MYEVNRNPSFYLKGEGTVQADYNRLELKNIIPEQNEIIISYHWMKNFRAIPTAQVERVFLAGDPVGFIKIKNPHKSLVLVNNY